MSKIPIVNFPYIRFINVNKLCYKSNCPKKIEIGNWLLKDGIDLVCIAEHGLDKANIGSFHLADIDLITLLGLTLYFFNPLSLHIYH